MDWIKVTPETMPPENETVIVSVVMTGTTRPHHILWSGATWSKDNGWKIAETDCDGPAWITQGKTEVLFWRPFQEVNDRQKRPIAMELNKMLLAARI